MNRREALAATASAIGASILEHKTAQGRDLLWPESILASTPSRPPWEENDSTRHLESLLSPRLEDIRRKRNLHALTPGEWRYLAENHQALWDEHSRLANLYHLDLAVQARQVELHRKFRQRKMGKEAITQLLHDGTHASFSRRTPGFERVARFVRNHPDSAFEPVIDCSSVWAAGSVQFAVGALIMAEVPPIATVLAGLGILCDVIAIAAQSFPRFFCP